MNELVNDSIDQWLNLWLFRYELTKLLGYWVHGSRLVAHGHDLAIAWPRQGTVETHSHLSWPGYAMTWPKRSQVMVTRPETWAMDLIVYQLGSRITW